MSFASRLLVVLTLAGATATGASAMPVFTPSAALPADSLLGAPALEFAAVGEPGPTVLIETSVAAPAATSASTPLSAPEPQTSLLVAGALAGLWASGRRGGPLAWRPNV